MTLKEFGILILSIIAVLLFALNYPIAEYLAPWDVSPDVNLGVRFNIYALVIASCFILTSVKHTKWSKLILSIGIGLCIGDVSDRYIFDITKFQWNDIVVLVSSIFFSFKKHIYASKTSTNS